MVSKHRGDGSPFPYIDLRDGAPPYSPESLGDAECAEEDQLVNDDSSSISPGRAYVPVERWRNVFEFVRAYSQHDAAQLLLFSKAVRAEAESVLYHEPHLASLRAAMVFADTVSSAPRLARSVKAISFAQWPDNKAHSSVTRAFDVENGTFDEDPDAIERSLDINRCRIVGTALEKLRRLTSVTICDRTAMRTIAAVFDKTRVRLLRIVGEHLVLDQPTVVFLKSQQRLEELRLYHRDSEDFETLGLRRIRVLSCPYRLLAGLRDDHLRRLTHLNVTSVMSEDDIAGIIHAVGPQLVSLRLEQNAWKQQGRLYPTNGHAWNGCPRLKFLHVRHCQPHANAMCYLSHADDSVDASNLPPALKTLVWSPAWTRARTHHLYPDERKRAEIRRFAEAVLRASATLRTVIYEWGEEAFYKCFLLGSGGLREISTISAEADDETWSYVR